jgi:DNA-binding NtrC family response regulator
MVYQFMMKLVGNYQLPERLGIGRNTITRKLQELGIDT